MFKYLAVFLFIGSLWGMDFSKCEQYYRNASVEIGELNGKKQYAVAIKSLSSTQKTNKNNAKVVIIGYFKVLPKLRDGVKVLKEDKFNALYSFKIDDALMPKAAYDLLSFDARTIKNENLAAISYSGANKGKLIHLQKSFLDYGKFSAQVAPNAMISNICYQAYGLGSGDGFVEKKYIDRFLNQSSAYYGDIGIRLDKNLNVSKVDIFFPKNPFKRNDKILSIDKIKAKNYKDVEWQIVNLKENSMAQIEILRDNKNMKFDVKVGRLYGGILLSDTFLERYGLLLGSGKDGVVELKKAYNFHGNIYDNNPLHLRLGDKVLRVNQTIVTPQNFSTLLSAHQSENLSVLIQRDGFEFFINSKGVIKDESKEGLMQ